MMAQTEIVNIFSCFPITCRWSHILHKISVMLIWYLTFLTISLYNHVHLRTMNYINVKQLYLSLILFHWVVQLSIIYLSHNISLLLFLYLLLLIPMFQRRDEFGLGMLKMSSMWQDLRWRTTYGNRGGIKHFLELLKLWSNITKRWIMYALNDRYQF